MKPIPTSTIRRRPGLAATVAMGLVRVYRLTISPALHALTGSGCGCRFHPTCSEYARESLAQHGFFRGSWLALKRLARCHPWHPGGFDPVPVSNRSSLIDYSHRHHRHG